MGLFDALASQATEALSGALGGSAQELASPQNLQALAGLLGQSDSGGLSGLVQQFSQQGLGAVIQSWIGDGQNLPISAEQIQAVLGNEQVQRIAQALGFDPAQAAQLLTELLPQAVKLLSSGGGVGDLLSQGASLLGQLGGRN